MSGWGRFHQVAAFAYEDPLRPGLSITSCVQYLPLNRWPFRARHLMAAAEKETPPHVLKAVRIDAAWYLLCGLSEPQGPSCKMRIRSLVLQGC